MLTSQGDNVITIIDTIINSRGEKNQQNDYKQVNYNEKSNVKAMEDAKNGLKLPECMLLSSMLHAFYVSSRSMVV